MTFILKPKHTEFKIEDGKTIGNPFPCGLDESESKQTGAYSFRIPAMITLKSGRIVAAADCRWNTTYDGGGIDTIVSYSDDNFNWNYSLVNYNGDNGNKYNGENSTCFIDPCLVTDGDTIWMACDLNPYGIALNGRGNTAPNNSTGFDECGNLLLSKDNHVNYDYYLDMEDYMIYNNLGLVQSEYRVDRFFNIYGNNINSNLFFKDSPFKVKQTTYIYLRKSEDGGISFGYPKLLTLKNDSENAFLISPGRGLYTNGIIIFPTYSYTLLNNGTAIEKMCLIYSVDGGNTWNRTKDAIPYFGNSSEAAIVDLGNGRLRLFFRHTKEPRLKYVDAFIDSFNNITYGNIVTTENIVNSACQLSAIILSKKKDGKDILLLSCPTGPNEMGAISSAGGNINEGGQRLNGKIFVGIIENDNERTIKWATPIKVNDNNTEFMYSCLTEAFGNVNILYENHQSGWGVDNSNPKGKICTIDYKSYNIEKIRI